MIDVTVSTLTLFLCVCVATTFTVGFFLILSALIIKRSIDGYTKEQRENNEAAQQFLAMKRDELSAMIGAAKAGSGPRALSAGDLLRGLRGGNGPEDKGPKGSA